MLPSCVPNCAYTASVDKNSQLTVRVIRILAEHSLSKALMLILKYSQVVATRMIKEGEPLSIDFGNNFYRPTESRQVLLLLLLLLVLMLLLLLLMLLMLLALTSRLQEEILMSHGFVCECEMCTVAPDKCRYIWIPAVNSLSKSLSCAVLILKYQLVLLPALPRRRRLALRHRLKVHKDRCSCSLHKDLRSCC